jgi:hypothetical protein
MEPGMQTTIPPAQAPTQPLPRARSRGGLIAGVAIAVIGLWGAIAPYVGPTIQRQTSTRGRHRRDVNAPQHLTLNLIPGLVAIAAGVVLILLARRLQERGRRIALVAAGVALAAGIWFVIGPGVWNVLHAKPVTQPKSPASASRLPIPASRRFLVQMLDALGPGLLLVGIAAMALAGFALGRRPPLAAPAPTGSDTRVTPPVPPAPPVAVTRPGDPGAFPTSPGGPEPDWSPPPEAPA